MTPALPDDYQCTNTAATARASCLVINNAGYSVVHDDEGPGKMRRRGNTKRSEGETWHFVYCHERARKMVENREVGTLPQGEPARY